VRPGPVRERRRHSLSDIDAIGRHAVCVLCGPVTVYRGSGNYKANDGWRCYGTRGPKHGLFKTDPCVWCGFSGHPAMNEIDHINNDHDDDSEGNHQLLCGRCHNLKSWLVTARVPESEWLRIREKYGAVIAS
jgi:hypothetical protein